VNKLAVFVPFALFLVLSVFLFKGLERDPTELPSALIGEAFPEFFLPQLLDPQSMRSRDDFTGQVVLVNVWATWCFACRIEHPMLNDLAEQGVKIVGLNYKDQRSDATKWLEERGNPYLFNIFDAEGSLGFDLGVYGAPETYLVDAEGIVRQRRVGVVDQRVWDEQFRDLYQQLLSEAK
jgi:cytochrome c biogenesis protein CcmG/thiol:disulfide interchange protein DsbE